MTTRLLSLHPDQHLAQISEKPCSLEQLQHRALEGDVEAAQSLASATQHAPASHGWLVACALLASQFEWIWADSLLDDVVDVSHTIYCPGKGLVLKIPIPSDADRTAPAPFKPCAILRSLSTEARKRIHLPLSQSVTDFFAEAVANGGWLACVRAAMKAHRRCGWAAWRRHYNNALLAAHVKAFTRSLRSREVHGDANAFSHIAAKNGLAGICAPVLDSAIRLVLSNNDIKNDEVRSRSNSHGAASSIQIVLAQARADIRLRFEAGKRFAPPGDRQLPKLLALMDQHPQALFTETAWRLAQQKRIRSFETQARTQLEAGTLPPFQGGAR